MSHTGDNSWCTVLRTWRVDLVRTETKHLRHLIHGNADEVVPSTDSTRMYDALHNAGVPVELHMYAGQPHAFDADPFLGRQVAAIMAGFINRYVD